MGQQAKRASRCFELLLVWLVAVLVLSLFNFELLSATVSTYLLPRFVEKEPCNGSVDPSLRSLGSPASSSADESKVGSLKAGSSCSRTCGCKGACPPAQEKVIVVEEKIVEKIVNSGPVFNQWWAEGKSWHTPGKFPLCTMDACFNYTRCQSMDELLVYHYNVPASPVRYFSGFNSTPWYTPDPDKACLFFVFQDVDSPWRPHPSNLEHWNNGLNHVLITFADLWEQRNPPQETIGNASVLSSGLYETTYRPGFDIGIPLPGRTHLRHLQKLKPSERKYLLTFRGTRYLGHHGEGTFRSHANFRNMHNGKDVIVVTTCRHAINDLMRKEKPDYGVGCDEDDRLYDKYSYGDLMNSTFSLSPAGKSGSSYRFIEVLGAGAIPVLIADNHVKPFEKMIQWPRCALQFPTSEMHRIVPALRGMSELEIEERQKYCLWAYNEFLKDNATLLRSVMRALKARFFGVFAKFSEISPIYATK